MVDLKQALSNANDFARSSLGAARTMDIRLEEIESSMVDGNAVWLITLSNSPIDEGPLSSVRTIAAVLGADTTREYKIFIQTALSGMDLDSLISIA